MSSRRENQVRGEIAQKPNGQDSREKRMTNEFDAGAAQPDR